MNPLPAIRTQNLAKTYVSASRTVRALKGITLEIATGELFGLFGANGAGKSTFVRILATLLAPTTGCAHVGGYDVAIDELQVRALLGLVASDERAFYGRLSCRDNLRFYGALQDLSQARAKERTEYVLQLFGLKDQANSPVQSLSTGQKQRLNMARALLHDPPILFLDEPTKSMDVQTSDLVRRLVRRELVDQQGKTVLYISHELYEMDGFCDRVAIIANGELRALGTPQELGSRLPRRAVFRITFRGDADQVKRHWQELDQVAAVTPIASGENLSVYELTLKDEREGAWLPVLRAIGSCGGHLEAWQRAENGSLADVVRFFGKSGDAT